MSWEPLKPDHAIERVRFEVQFAEALPRKVVEQLGLLHDKDSIETRFGPREPQQMAQFMVGPGGPQVVQGNGGNEVGWQSTRKAGNNNAIVEALTVQNSLLSYESSDYRGWTKSLARFRKLCDPLLSMISQFVDAAHVNLEYTDRFIFDGPLKQAKPEGLLPKEILALLPESALSGRELWHVHRGWYEDLEQAKCLVNQNFDAQQVTNHIKQEARSIVIFSKCLLRKDFGAISISEVTPKFDALHARSIALIAASLTKEMNLRIGLSKEAT